MLLRNSISNTKKFFQRTLQSLKSLFSGGRGDHYERLHKRADAAPPYNSIMSAQPSFNQKELDYFYNDFADRWDTDQQKATRRNKKKMVISREEVTRSKSFEEGIFKRSPEKDNSSSRGKSTRERRIYLVAEKLKELERMDLSNVDHVLDIEEVLHYYSRLTCPAYLEIVDKFFMDMYAELLAPPVPPAPPPPVTPSPPSVNSRHPRLHG